jgi:uracil-DNA glycosylase family 4
MLIIGLAPAAHGGNRTGRIFTGDRSGDWLFRALHKSGFSNQPISVSRDDGLKLYDCFISATVRCAPPDNKPLRSETENCSEYLSREAQVLWPKLKVVVVLGKIAFDWWIRYLRSREIDVGRPLPKFGHGFVYDFPRAPRLLCSFHPSQQNTLTGKLTEHMFDQIWNHAKELVCG